MGTRTRIAEVVSVTIAEDNHAIDVAEVMDELKIDLNDLPTELEGQAGSFAWLAVLAAQAEYEAGRAKQSLAALRAAIGKELHAENEGKGRNDRMTEATIDEHVTTDERVLSMVDDYTEAARRAAILGALREAYRQRHSTLQALSRGTYASQQAET